MPVPAGKRLQQADRVDDRFIHHRHRAMMVSQDSGTIVVFERSWGDFQPETCTKKSEPGSQRATSPQQAGPAADRDLAQIGFAATSQALGPDLRHLLDSQCRTGGGASERIFQTAVNDSLGRDSLATTQPRTFQQHGLVASPDEFIENPETGNAASNNNHVRTSHEPESPRADDTSASDDLVTLRSLRGKISR